MQVAAGERGDLRVTALQYRGRPAPDNRPPGGPVRPAQRGSGDAEERQ